MDITKIDPELIATSLSQKHIQSIIEDLISIIKLQNELADEVLMFNPKSGKIEGEMLVNLQNIAITILNKQS